MVQVQLPPAQRRHLDVVVHRLNSGIAEQLLHGPWVRRIDVRIREVNEIARAGDSGWGIQCHNLGGIDEWRPSAWHSDCDPPSAPNLV